MNFKEAWKLAIDGAKIRCVNWDDGLYVRLTDNGSLFWNNSSDDKYIPHLYDLQPWEIYKEPMVTTRIVDVPERGISLDVLELLNLFPGRYEITIREIK